MAIHPETERERVVPAQLHVNPSTMAIHVGAKFNSFAEFEQEFRVFQVTTNTLFVTKVSKTVGAANMRLTAGQAPFDAKLKFANVTYVCKHGGAARTTGKGIRPHQRTRKNDCPAKVVLAARRARQQLEITELKVEHNHEVSPEIFRTYPECRQLNAEEINFVKSLRELNVRPSLIVEKLREQSGKAVIAKDLYNLTHSARNPFLEKGQQEFLSNSSECNPEAGSSEEPRILSMPGPSFDKMNRNQRYDYAMQTLRSVADNLADCEPDIFATRLAFLESVNASWLRREDVTQSVPYEEYEDVDVAENITIQDVCPAIVSEINRQQETDRGQVSVATECASSGSNLPVPDSDTPSSASRGCTATYQIRLSERKSRGRPSKSVPQIRLKRARELYEDGHVAIKHLPEKAQAKLLLTGFIDERLCQQVMEESDVEVCPEALPSALLECRVSLPRLKKYSTPNPRSLLISSVAAKNKERSLQGQR
uniref:ZSWIM3 N-terminal domain-containing protein n=1 Tax=Ixodes ricinus TaxID=34613 RepID=A0A0K8RJX5_IXORI